MHEMLSSLIVYETYLLGRLGVVNGSLLLIFVCDCAVSVLTINTDPKLVAGVVTWVSLDLL